MKRKTPWRNHIRNKRNDRAQREMGKKKIVECVGTMVHIKSKMMYKMKAILSTVQQKRKREKEAKI